MHLVALLAIGTALLAMARRRKWIQLMVVAPLFPITINLVVDAERPVVFQFLVGLAVLLCAIAFDPGDGRVARVQTSSDRPRPSYGAPLALTVAALGATVHFWRVGAPILSSNVEVTRFAVGESGFFGLPSRMYLFGLPLALALALQSDVLHGRRPGTSTVSRLALTAFIVSRLLSGFKSALIEVIVTYGLLILLTGHGFDRQRLKRFAVATGFGISAVFLFGSQYAGYRTTGATEAIRIRLTEQSSEATELVLSASDTRRLGAASVAQDGPHFVRKYLGFGRTESFSFNQRVSSELTRTPLSETSFIVPVTTTAIAEAIYDAGLLFGSLLLAAFGLVLNRVVSGAAAASSHRRFLIFAAVVLASSGFASKGGLVYAFLNWIFIAIFLVIMTVTALAMKRVARASARK